MEPIFIKDNPISGISRLEIFPHLEFVGQIIYPLFIDSRTYVIGKISGLWMAKELPADICRYVGRLIESGSV
jgi:hypothetical protein